MSKKEKYLYIFFAGCALLLCVYFIYVQTLSPLDGMIWSWVHKRYSTLESVKELNFRLGRSAGDDEYMKNDGRFEYKEEYLKDGYRVAVSFSEKTLYIDEYLKFDDTAELFFFIMYEYRSKKVIFFPATVVNRSNVHYGKMIEDEKSVRRYLEKNGISQDDIIECYNYALFDVVMQTWLGKNFYHKELRPSDYRGLEIEDHSFDFDWRGME